MFTYILLPLFTFCTIFIIDKMHTKARLKLNKVLLEKRPWFGKFTGSAAVAAAAGGGAERRGTGQNMQNKSQKKG
jgi:hypothetical protein